MTSLPSNTGLSRQRGLTLIELMIVLVILAVVASLGGPTFESVRQSSRLRFLSNSFTSDIYLARNEAIKRNTSVRLCKSADGLTCTTSGEWEQGWVVMDPNDVPIQSQDGAWSGYGVRSSPDVDEIAFNSQGFTTGLFQIKTCTTSTSPGQREKQITLLPNGSARTATVDSTACP